jgi:hypothetical protein
MKQMIGDISCSGFMAWSSWLTPQEENECWMISVKCCMTVKLTSNDDRVNEVNNMHSLKEQFVKNVKVISVKRHLLYPTANTRS